MDSGAFVAAFNSLLRTTAAHFQESNAWLQLMVTADFAATVDLPPNNTLDEYLRPVHWILNNSSVGQMWLVISLYEANELPPAIRDSPHVRLHIYLPNVAKAMLFFDNLTFYAIPTFPQAWEPQSGLRCQPNLFAGQLYESYCN
jgi:hypothetical protein